MPRTTQALRVVAARANLDDTNWMARVSLNNLRMIQQCSVPTRAEGC